MSYAAHQAVTQVPYSSQYTNSNVNRYGSASRSIRSVNVPQIYLMTSNEEDVTNLTLHGEGIYLIKIIGEITRKHSNVLRTEYDLKDSSCIAMNNNTIPCVIWKDRETDDGLTLNYHGLNEGDCVSIIGKVFKEEHNVKLTVHHMEVNSKKNSGNIDHQKKVKLHRAENELDKLVNGLKNKNPSGYQQYLAMLRQEQDEYESQYREQVDQRRDRMQHSNAKSWNQVNKPRNMSSSRVWNNGNNGNWNNQQNGYQQNGNRKNGYQQNGYQQNQYQQNGYQQNGYQLSEPSGYGQQQVTNQWGAVQANNPQRYSGNNGNGNQSKQRRFTQDMNHENEMVPTLQSVNENTRRRTSAPYGSTQQMQGNGNWNGNHNSRKAEILRAIKSRYRLTNKDVTPQSVQRNLSFKASVQEILGYFHEMAQDGEVYGTVDDYHWRPV